MKHKNIFKEIKPDRLYNLLAWLLSILLFSILLYLFIQSFRIQATIEPNVHNDFKDIKDINDSNDTDTWQVFTQALIWVESRGNTKAIGKNQDGGILQITPIYVKEANRIIKQQKYKLEDRFDSIKSLEMFTIIQARYNPEKDIDKAIYYHNKHADKSYAAKIKERMEIIKNTRYD